MSEMWEMKVRVREKKVLVVNDAVTFAVGRRRTLKWNAGDRVHLR